MHLLGEEGVGINSGMGLNTHKHPMKELFSTHRLPLTLLEQVWRFALNGTPESSETVSATKWF